MYIAAVTLVVAAVSAYLQYEQAEQQAQVQKYNAKVGENRAIEERQRAAFAAEQQREENRRVLGRQRALYGQAGVDVNAGSPLLVMADTARQAELDAQIILSGGQSRASAAEAQARLSRYGAGAAQRAGYIGAGTTLLSGAATGYRQYSGATPAAGSNPTGSGIYIP